MFLSIFHTGLFGWLVRLPALVLVKATLADIKGSTYLQSNIRHLNLQKILIFRILLKVIQQTFQT